MTASNPRTSAATNAAAPELVITRVFDAPRELVFKAWTDPKQVAQWWGPRGFTNPVCELDVRPGGAIRIHMRAPDGTVYPMTGVYQEVVEPERLVFICAALDEKGHPLFEVLTTVTFAEQGGKTTQKMQASVVKTTPAAAPHIAGMEAGWTQSLERLEAYVAKALGMGKTMTGRRHDPAEDAAGREIVITRVFDAPRELVWEAWTNPKHVVQWWGPRGFTTTIQEMDVRPGGVWQQIMHGPDGTDYPSKSVFTEVVKPQRIVFSHTGGKKGGPGASFESTWTFDAQGDKTKVTIRMVFPSAADRDMVVKEYGAIEGGNQTLERLGAFLAKM
jgi:uncharacterized protein YndB with AHSA1/START domain